MQSAALPLVRHRPGASLVWWAASRLRPRPAVAAADVGGEQDLHPRAARQARRNGSGHRAARLLQPDARRAGLPARHRHRARRSASCSACRRRCTRMFDPIMQVLRPISPLAWLPLGLVLFQKSEPAALFAIAVCSMWPTVINTMMGVRAIPQDYWNVAKVLRLSRIDDLHEDHRAGDAALHVHRLSPQPRHRLAGHRRQRDADRHAGRRRLPLAGIQQPGLRAHPAGHHHHRRRRLRARSADGAGRSAGCGRS